LFGYYATRPICTWFHQYTDSKGLSAGLTVLALLLPLLLLTLYVGLRVVQQLQQRFEGGVISMLVSRVFGVDIEDSGLTELLQDPPSLGEVGDLLFGSNVQQGLQVLDALLGAVLLLALAATLSYALLVYDEALSTAFAELVDGRDETVFVYARAVDTDLESIFFGNLLFVLAMSVLATATYLLTNLVAPPGLAVPMVFTLGLLTGLTSLIPLVVSKVVYLPVVAFLALSTARSGDGQFLFVAGVLVTYFLVLDILPQSVLQPYISGRQLNPMLLLFAYILGPILFGWYGFFLMPIVLVLMLEVVRIVLPELLHRDAIVSEPGLAEGTGAGAAELEEDSASQSPSGTDDDDGDAG
jgi:predicted PurR-regulated permease PerM